jgi:SAM-dependent methyltransferase
MNMHFFSRLLRKVRRLGQHTRQLFTVLNQFRQVQVTPNPRFSAKWQDRWLHLRDATSTTSFDRHYVFHTAWATRVVAQINPRQHVDVASSLYFVSSVSAFIPTKFIDFRPADLGLSGLRSGAGTLMNLPFESNSVESLSCMHVVEHVGLGRYGDPFDYDGDLKAIAELIRVLAIGGHLLFVVPIGGSPRIQFNAHRIYTYQQVVAMAAGLMLQEFALIPDDGSTMGLVRHAEPEHAALQRYGCGCFHFIKPEQT